MKTADHNPQTDDATDLFSGFKNTKSLEHVAWFPFRVIAQRVRDQAISLEEACLDIASQLGPQSDRAAIRKRLAFCLGELEKLNNFEKQGRETKRITTDS